MVAAVEMVAVVDSDRVDADAVFDSDQVDVYDAGEMATVYSDNVVAAVLFDSSNNIESNCIRMDSHIYNKLHLD
jgi:hypothetical protein